MDNKKKEEIFITAKYLDILQSLISKLARVSIVKIITFSFILKNYDYPKLVFPKTTKVDLSIRLISLMQNDKINFFKDIEIIVKCLSILKENKMITINNQNVINIKCSSLLINSDLMDQICVSINQCSDKVIIREVLNYV